MQNLRTVASICFAIVIQIIVLPTDGWGASALGQLEDLTGQKVDRSGWSTPRPSPPPPSVLQDPASRLAPVRPMSPARSMQGMVLNTLFNSFMSGAMAGQEEIDQAYEASQAQAQAEAAAYVAAQQQRAAIVAAQRTRRDAEDAANEAALAQALGGPGPSPTGGEELVSALVDPVRLPPPPLPAAAPPDITLDLRERMDALIAEDHHVGILYQRLLEEQEALRRTLNDANDAKRAASLTVADLNAWTDEVAKAVQRNTERGMSLAADVVLDHGPEANAKLLEHLGKLKGNVALWQHAQVALANVNDFLAFSAKLGEGLQTMRETFDWAKAKTDLLEDLDFVGEHFPGLDAYYKSGKAIVGSSVDVMQELHARKEITGLADQVTALAQAQQGVADKVKGLVNAVGQTRAELAQASGLTEQQLRDLYKKNLDIFGSKPTSIGSYVPKLGHY